jgi:PAS domain S-box-containing protein
MILATLAAAGLMLLDLQRREQEHAKGEIVSLSRILAEQTTRTFEGVALTMRGVRERLSDPVGSRLVLDSLPVHLLLLARSAGLPQVKSLFLIDSAGLSINSSRTDFIPSLSMRERSFFAHFAKGGETEEIFISGPEKARVDGRWAYYASTRLLDASGKLRGVLVASISIDYFESLYASIDHDFVTRIRLLNREGQLLAGKPHDEEGFGKASMNPDTLAKLRTQPAEGFVLDSEDAAEGRSFVAYRQVAKYPLLIAAAVDEEEALIPWRRIAAPIVVGVGLILLLISATSILMVSGLWRRGALESVLKESDEKIRHMVQSVRDAIMTVNATRHIVLFNSSAERMLGIRAEQAIGGELGEVLAGCLPQAQLSSLLRYLDEGWRSPAGLANLGIVELRREGQAVPVELSLSTTTFHGELLLTAVFRDLTERQRAERELLETNRQLQELSASLQNVREEERTRIARELHDELGQLLTGIRMEVSWLGGRLQPEQQGLADKVASIKSQIDQTIVSVRRISSELRPLVLDDLGFAAAAHWYVDQFAKRTGLPVELHLPDRDPEQGGAIATALFRILQESLTNVARHARATKVDVAVSHQNGEWRMNICDDGQGFTQQTGKRLGIGLVGMRERVQILGGRFFVTTTPGSGSSIALVIPADTRGVEGVYEKAYEIMYEDVCEEAIQGEGSNGKI